jgi:hypothetical protein
LSFSSFFFLLLNFKSTSISIAATIAKIRAKMTSSGEGE